MKNEGPGAFYKGIGPAWLREASYTSLRLGLYEPVKQLVGANEAGAGFLRKFIAGALAGAIGSCAGNPFDVLKTKMMANKDSDEGLGYYFSEIKKAEGFMGFYKGFNTNVIRAMVLNATKMACYDCQELPHCLIRSRRTSPPIRRCLHRRILLDLYCLSIR